MKLTPVVLLTAALAAGGGCRKPIEPAVPVWQTVPRLPAPKAGSYNRSKEPAPDPAVRSLAEGLPWDAALSGAAAGLALDLIKARTDRTLTRWDVREAAWSAGYAYPIADARAWNASVDGSPPPDLLAWLQGVDATDDLGLVRARGQDGDLWVALRARPLLDVGRVPRQVAVGGVLELPAVPGARARVADANGHVTVVDLDRPASLTTATRGEWIVQVEQDDQLAALFPVYVGIVPPELPLITDVEAVVTSTDAIARAERLLAEIRLAYGVEGVTRDFMLDAGARSLLGGGTTTAEGVVGSLGLTPANTALWDCRGTTIEACLDRMVWRPENRLALLDANSALGLAASVDPEGVRLVGILGRTD